MAKDHSEGTRNIGNPTLRSGGSARSAAPAATRNIGNPTPRGGGSARSAAPAQGHNSQPQKHKRTRIRDIEFNSTCLASASYDPSQELLFDVYFTDGRGPYAYDCSPDELKDLKAEGGTFFNAVLRE
jgi:hypothetical protein